jgi:hypothetical protein
MLCTLSLSIKLTDTNITFPFPLTYVKNEKESDSPIGFFFYALKENFTIIFNDLTVFKYS